MDKMKKKRIKRYVSWACIVALVTALAVLPLLAGTDEDSDGPEASILSDTAQMRLISSELLGGGTLTAEESVQITVPSAVKLTAFLVSNGDTVSEGDAIASVDRVSVMSAITQVQETMDYLAEEIDDASSDSVSSKIIAQAGGTVKLLYAAEGDSVEDVMLTHGALAVLSLDGMMAVDIERNTDLAAGDSVCVTLSDGEEAAGRVESNLNGTLVVTVTDDGYGIGEKVYVTTEDGDRLGVGELYIHSAWNAVGLSGTVGKVRVKENQTVSAGDSLMTLTDTGYTAKYQQLARQHREYEALMLELFRLYQSETLTAPCDGVVSGIDENSLQLLASGRQNWYVSFLANAPEGDPDAQYQNYVGQVREVGIDGLVMKMNPQSLMVTDYTDLSQVPLESETMTEEVIYSGQAPVYELTEGEWIQIPYEQILPEDILLFAGDAEGNFVWIVRVPRQEPESPESTGPEATEPVGEVPEATEPVTAEPEATEPEQPAGDEMLQTNPDSQQSQSGGMSGNGGFAQGSAQEETFEVYSLETVTVASVTPRNTMTLEISVDELDISRISLGQEAVITVDALIGESFDGYISDIGNTGESSGGNSKFTVELTLDRSENMLTGMNAAVSIDLSAAENVLTIPVAALVESGTEILVYTGCDEESGKLLDPVAVEVGLSDGEYAQILSGLSEGDAVYYAYYDTLTISNAVKSGRFSLFG